jgi:hypothetical protein
VVVQDEGVGNKYHQEVHLKIELQIDYVCEDDEVHYLALEFIAYFLG